MIFLKWFILRTGPVNAAVSRPNPDRVFRAASWVRLMARQLEDCVKAAIFVTVVTEYSLGANCLRKSKCTPNYQSLGFLHGYKLGDYGSLNPYRVLTCGAMTIVRQAIHLSDCSTATGSATMVRCESKDCGIVAQKQTHAKLYIFRIVLRRQAWRLTRLSATPARRYRIQHRMLMRTVVFGYNRDCR